MEEVIGAALRFISTFIYYVLFEILFMGIGWLTLKFLTFGKYPNKDTSEKFMSYTGITVFIIFITTLTLYYYTN